MISVVLAMIGAAATGAAIATKVMRKRGTPKPSPNARAAAPSPRSPANPAAAHPTFMDRPYDDSAATPFSLGDVLILDHGRGMELWLARQIVFFEQQAQDESALLFFFESEGVASERKIVSFDLRCPHEVAILTVAAPAPSNEHGVVANPVDGTVRFPTTIETCIDRRAALLQLVERRVARSTRAQLQDVDLASDLPPASDATKIGFYRSRSGDDRAIVIANLAEREVHCYSGSRVSIDDLTILSHATTVR
ncbi:MAG: hypothetical protein NVS3B20_26270 [Polyangiales bacterium]